MWKQNLKCRTEDESFTFSANPMHLRAVAAVILAEHGAKFAEISDEYGNVLMLASHNPEREFGQDFIFAFPEENQ